MQGSTKVPSFGTSPNEFVTAAGVALLSLAHQLSVYSQDSNMASAIMFAAKLETLGGSFEEILVVEIFERILRMLKLHNY